jgi:hypothetical protein
MVALAGRATFSYLMRIYVCTSISISSSGSICYLSQVVPTLLDCTEESRKGQLFLYQGKPAMVDAIQSASKLICCWIDLNRRYY